jgi:hypothetical protein
MKRRFDHVEPVVVGRVHLVKERSGHFVTTKCGTISDQRTRAPVKVTIWNDYDCAECLSIRPLQARQKRQLRGVKRRSEMT